MTLNAHASGAAGSGSAADAVHRRLQPVVSLHIFRYSDLLTA